MKSYLALLLGLVIDSTTCRWHQYSNKQALSEKFREYRHPRYSLHKSKISLTSDEGECKAIDSRVDDAWCEADCMCDWCPGCGNDYCAGFCEWVDPNDPVNPDNPVNPDDPIDPPGPAPTHAPIPIPPENLCDSPFLRNVVYLDYKIDWSNLSNDIKASIDACFNVIILSFYIGTSSSAADALITWQSMSKSERREILDYAHSKNAVIMMAEGGATDHIEPLVEAREGHEYAKDACQFVVDYDLDGIDFDIELTPGNSGPYRDGSMQSFIYDVSKECRRIIGPNRLISHAPQAPYFGDWAGPTLGYTQVMKEYPELIDFVNVQFYNQGSNYYDTYQNLFVAGDGWTAESAVFEMEKNGVPLNRIVVGKPAGPAGYASNGYVDYKKLHDMGCQAKTERNWVGGFMTWMYAKGSSDYVNFGTNMAAAC